MSKKAKIITASIVAFFVVVIIVLCVIVSNNNIYKGIHAAGVDVGGLSVSEAVEKLLETDYFDSELKFECGGRNFTASPADIGLKCDAEKTAVAIHSYGRDTNVFYRLGNIFNIMLNPVDLPIEISFDDEKLDMFLAENIGDMCEPTAEPVYRVENDKLFIKNGSEGSGVNKELLRKDLASLAFDGDKTVEIVVETINPTAISAQTLHEQYAAEVVNADYTVSGCRISYMESKAGIEFSVADADKIIAENINNPYEYYIPLTVIHPEVTVETLEKTLFGDCLATYTTRYNPGDAGRTKNVVLAANHVNNVVLKKGDVFSYNDIVGERSIARGFAAANVYSGGNVVEGIGGGICQVSSTLYNAVLLADLEIVSRTNHSLPVSYVPLGRDATVSYGSIDFKFTNQYDNPVKIVASAGGGSLTVSVYGKKTTDKKVELYVETLSSTAFSVIEEPNDSIAEGTTKVKQSGSNGAVVNTYKKVIENGTVVSNKLLHKSVYNPINKIVMIPPVPETTEDVMPIDEVDDIFSEQMPPENTGDVPAFEEVDTASDETVTDVNLPDAVEIVAEELSETSSE